MVVVPGMTVAGSTREKFAKITVLNMNEVILKKHTTEVAIIQINRPECKNALNMAVRERLATCFSLLSDDDQVRAIVVTGNQEAFAAGADLVDLAQRSALDMMLRKTHLMWQAIADCPKPVIAAVAGYAFGGGCELAMHADIIIAGENASFSQPEIKVGIMPGAGGTQRLLRAVGKYNAMRLLLTGDAISAGEAREMGLVSMVVPDEQVLDRALAMARRIASMPPLAVAQIKEVVLAGQDASLDQALALERKAFQLLFATNDQKEGMQAFIEKRIPAYQGN